MALVVFLACELCFEGALVAPVDLCSGVELAFDGQFVDVLTGGQEKQITADRIGFGEVTCVDTEVEFSESVFATLVGAFKAERGVVDALALLVIHQLI